MKPGRRSVGRRTFLAGLLTGGGVAAGLGATASRAASPKVAGGAGTPPRAQAILYRRTEETARYYRTLYR